MSLDFDQYAAKGNAFVNRVAEKLQVQREQAARIVRSVLHALRNRLSLDTSFNLLAQLPIALKGVYVDGWKHTNDYIRLRHPEEFLDEVRRQDRGLAGYDFGNHEKAAKVTEIVFEELFGIISEQEAVKVIQSLPEPLQSWIGKKMKGSNYEETTKNPAP
jgi:uncharacterized protein (DUF2267 family)